MEMRALILDTLLMRASKSRRYKHSYNSSEYKDVINTAFEGMISTVFVNFMVISVVFAEVIGRSLLLC
jgi:hypothetical protein